MEEYILEMKDIVKRFPGTLALDKVGLNLKRGEIVALIGENGAGKSTLMNVLMGVYKKDEGTILLNGKEIENNSPYEALQNGIGMVPQELNLVPEISIGENIFLGSHQKKGALIDWKSTMKNAKEILNRLNVDVDPELKASSISAAYQQLISIARTIAVDSQVIVLDEPTASLTTVEIKKLFETVEILKKEGRAIIFITHHLDEVEEMADRVFVMRDGRLVKTADISELSIDDMIYYMANERVRKIERVDREVSEDIMLSIRDYSRRHEFSHVNIDVKKGEILGVAGLVGSGRTELFSCIYGITKKESGTLVYDGKEVEFQSPYEAVKAGIGLVPEERRKDGIFTELSIYENIMLPSYDTIKTGGRINFRAARERTLEEIRKLSIKTPSENTRIKNLSGGNQQKVILGRWLEKHVRLLILDEPTRGIDVHAKTEIYDLIRALSDRGVTIVVISSELDELAAIADRMVVMFEGAVKGELIPDGNLKREDILKVAFQ